MDGLRKNDVALFLTKIPYRKGLAFCFSDGNGIYPVAYVSKKLEKMAIEKWEKMIK